MHEKSLNNALKCGLKIVVALLFFSCSNKQEQGKMLSGGKEAKPTSYVEVGKWIDTVATPYVIDIKSTNKRLVFIGCEHQQDSSHPQFGIIEKYYRELKPQIAFNEGGQIPEKKDFSSMNVAIKEDGETGVNKYLANRAGIPLLNGDTPDSLEFAVNVKKNDPNKLFVYYVVERMVIPYRYGAYGEIPFEQFYNKAIYKWFKDFPLSNQQKSLENFKGSYKKYIGADFKVRNPPSTYEQDNFNVELFDYVNDSCEFCEIGRSSKILRDSILIQKIKTAFKSYDRILVTFGHGHALALEPQLQQIFK
ncbi:hypothetical protein CNR22_12770 [Sphingobacteriaceae bacterium]|nr:hypothetical protein CNR22_12770 [Sphingobacteriaceae bacterium]